MGLGNVNNSLVARYGSTQTLRRPSFGGGSNVLDDPESGTTDHDIVIYEAEASNQPDAATLISKDMRRFRASTEGLSVTPQTDDRLVIDGEELSIHRASPIRVQGSVVGYILEAGN